MNGKAVPAPEFNDEDLLQHSYKQPRRRYESIKPPKLRPRSHATSFNSSKTAHAISFRGESENALKMEVQPLNCSFDDDATYFEQCFTTLDKIGEGSFGEVFKVRSKEDGQLYAVKMSKQLFRSIVNRQQRLEEVKRYEQFSEHENCVRFYRAWEQGDRLYMQMELCRENLETYLARKRHIPEERIWSILLDLLLALKSLHDRNLLHLDIKLDNVLIADDDSCKLGDFGLVIDVDRANCKQATEGDSRYIAPEILQDNFSKAADIFSLGIAILELSCCLELPSHGLLWHQLRSGTLPVDFLKSISTELQAIIKNMMATDPNARPTVDQLLGHKKLAGMLRNRNRWKLVTKAKQTLRVSKRAAWTKWCNFKLFLWGWFSSFLRRLRLKASKECKTPRRIKGTPARTRLPMDYSIDIKVYASTPRADHRASQEFSDSLEGSDSFSIPSPLSSTPLNGHGPKQEMRDNSPLEINGNHQNNHNYYHNHQNCRSRKDLTRTSFNLIGDICRGMDDDYSSIYGPGETGLTTNPNLNSSESSSSSFNLRKQLFSNIEDRI